MSIIKNGKEYLQGDGTWGFEVMVDGDDLVEVGYHAQRTAGVPELVEQFLGAAGGLAAGGLAHHFLSGDE